MYHSYLLYLIVIFILLGLYLVYKIKNKDLLYNKIKCFTEILFFLAISFFVLVLSPIGFQYNMTFIKAIVLFLSLFLLCFSFGLLQNNEKIYKKNIFVYIGLYISLLISITFFIGRRSLSIDFDRINHIYTGALIPFHTISLYFNGYASTKEIVYNIFGNAIMLVPLSLLLMIKNKKYNNIFRQLLIIAPIVIFIELFQEITWVGTFDVDDILLNLVGPIIFTFLITRFDIVGKIRKLFYYDFVKKREIKYFLYILSLIVPILFIIKFIFETIIRSIV